MKLNFHPTRAAVLVGAALLSATFAFPAMAAGGGGVDPEDFQPPVPTPPVVPFRQAVGCPSRRAGCRRSGCSPQNLRPAAAKVFVPHGPIGKGNTP